MSTDGRWFHKNGNQTFPKPVKPTHSVRHTSTMSSIHRNRNKILACSNHQYHNRPNHNHNSNGPKPIDEMQSIIRPQKTYLRLQPPRKLVLPRYSHNDSENQDMKPSLLDQLPKQVPKISQSEKCCFRKGQPENCIFRARNMSSLLDDEEEEDDFLRIQRARPIYEDEEEILTQDPLESRQRPPTVILRWGPARLSPDQMEGYNLGGLIMV
jgi:hypothetical protein